MFKVRRSLFFKEAASSVNPTLLHNATFLLERLRFLSLEPTKILCYGFLGFSLVVSGIEHGEATFLVGQK